MSSETYDEETDEEGQNRNYERTVSGYDPTPGLIDKLMEGRFPDEVEKVIQTELSPSMNLAFHTPEEIEFNRHLLNNRKEIKIGATPPRASLLQGTLRERMGYDRGIALSKDDRYNLSSAYQVVFARMTGGRNGNQQKLLAQQVQERTSVNSSQQINQKRSMWDKFLGRGN